MTSRLGCIADDYTGVTDAASAFLRAGLRTSRRFGFPAPGSAGAARAADVDVVALKTRSVPATDAVGHALAA